MPSGFTAATATPSSPIIDSRPMVGVEKRARIIPAMPATMRSGTPTTPTMSGSQPTEKPS
jgi:hypothetical protein